MVCSRVEIKISLFSVLLANKKRINFSLTNITQRMHSFDYVMLTKCYQNAIHYLKLQSIRETHFLVCFDVMLSSLLSELVPVPMSPMGRIPGFCVGSMSERAQ